MYIQKVEGVWNQKLLSYIISSWLIVPSVTEFR